MCYMPLSSLFSDSRAGTFRGISRVIDSCNQTQNDGRVFIGIYLRGSADIFISRSGFQELVRIVRGFGAMADTGIYALPFYCHEGAFLQ